MYKSALNFNREKYNLPLYRKVNPLKYWDLSRMLAIKEKEILCQS